MATAALYYTDRGRDYWVSKGIPSEKLFVAYNALDTDQQIRIRENLSRDEQATYLESQGLSGRIIVTFLGRLIPEKKPWVFVDAIEKASILEPGIVGLIIGDGPERQRLEKQVQQRGIADKVRFVGPLYDEKTIALYLMSSTAVLLPAFAGLAIQHAGVYGAPLILGDLLDSHGPEQEIVEDGRTGIWCPDEDADAFASAIIRLAHDHALRQTLSENLMRVIDSKYSIARMAQGFVDSVAYCLRNRVQA